MALEPRDAIVQYDTGRSFLELFILRKMALEPMDAIVQYDTGRSFLACGTYGKRRYASIRDIQ